jgi:hypothetical protein
MGIILTRKTFGVSSSEPLKSPATAREGRDCGVQLESKRLTFALWRPFGVQIVWT